MSDQIYRGEVYLADLSPVVGSEQGGFRPVLVIQNNIGNLYSPTVIVATMSGQIRGKKKIPTHYKVRVDGGQAEESLVLLEQIRTLDKQRLKKYVGKIKSRDMEKIDRCLEVSLALDKK